MLGLQLQTPVAWWQVVSMLPVSLHPQAVEEDGENNLNVIWETVGNVFHTRYSGTNTCMYTHTPSHEHVHTYTNTRLIGGRKKAWMRQPVLGGERKPGCASQYSLSNNLYAIHTLGA